MAITRPKPKPSAETFIAGAPDAETTSKPRGVRKGRKQQISLTIDQGLLDELDTLATRLGQSRASIINLAIYRAVTHGLVLE